MNNKCKNSIDVKESSKMFWFLVLYLIHVLCLKHTVDILAPPTNYHNKLHPQPILKKKVRKKIQIINFIHLLSCDSLDDEPIRTYTELTTVDVQHLASSSTNLQQDTLSFEIQNVNPIPSSQLSPSSAVRSIFTNLLQQHVPVSSSSSSSNAKKQKRTEGKYGEEITSSNRLNELKEKAAMPNSKKRPIKSTKQTNSTSIIDDDNDLEATTKKKRRTSKKKTEFITSSQATRAVATLNTTTSCQEQSNQNNVLLFAQSQQ